MGNTVSFPLVQGEKKSEYGHSPHFLLKLSQALINKCIICRTKKYPKQNEHICVFVVEMLTVARKSEIFEPNLRSVSSFYLTDNYFM